MAKLALKNAFSALSAAFFLVALAPGAAFSEARLLTFDEALRLAVEGHESVASAGEGLMQAGAALDKAESRVLPNVTAEGAFTKYSSEERSGAVPIQPSESSRLDLKLTQSLYSGGRDAALRKQAGYLIERSREGVDSARENVLRAAARAYYGVLKAEKDLEIKRAALNRAVERSKVASVRFSVGDVTRSAVLRAEADVARAEAELTRSGAELKDAKDVLRRLAGIPQGTDISIAEPGSARQPEGGPDELVKKAFASRRDLRQAELEERSAEEGISYASGSFLPTARFEALFSHREQSPETQFFVDNSLSGTIVVTYPIFEGGLRKAELSEARSKRRDAELRRIALKKEIELQVRDAFSSVESAGSLIESYRRQLAFAEEDYRMVFEQFKHGLATTVDVTDADTNLLSAQRSLMNSSYDQQLSIIELKYAIGALLDDLAGTAKTDNTLSAR